MKVLRADNKRAVMRFDKLQTDEGTYTYDLRTGRIVKLGSGEGAGGGGSAGSVSGCQGKGGAAGRRYQPPSRTQWTASWGSGERNKRMDVPMLSPDSAECTQEKD